MAFLYITTKGLPWRRHSYSAGLDYEQSPYKYYLRRILGWKQKDNKASLKFGRALEESIQFYHENNGTRGVETFAAKWSAYKDDVDLKYTKVERDWANLNRCGQEMMRLYAILQPTLPIPMGAQAIFQREFSKEVFPNDPNYGEIEDAGKLDIICYVDPNHPMLDKMTWKSEYGVLRPLIVDIKTGAKDFHETKGIAKHDMQLRRYSWLSGIRDVAFLWFKKGGTSLSKGCSITLLEDTGRMGFQAGNEAVVACEGEEDVWLVLNDYFVIQMEEAQGRKNGRLDTTKAAIERRNEWLAENATAVPKTAVTRCRVQFNTARITAEEAAVAGRQAGRQIVGIVNSWKTNTWDNLFGVRYPNDSTNDPYFIAFVQNDENYRKLNFEKADEDVFDDFFAEAEEE